MSADAATEFDASTKELGDRIVGLTLLEARKVVDYLRFTRDFNAQFPGFGADVHGLVSEEQVPGGPKRYFVDCVQGDRKSTRLNSSHIPLSRMPSSA